MVSQLLEQDARAEPSNCTKNHSEDFKKSIQDKAQKGYLRNSQQANREPLLVQIHPTDILVQIVENHTTNFKSNSLKRTKKNSQD